MSVKFFGISNAVSPGAPGVVTWDMISGDPKDNADLLALISELSDEIADAILAITGVS